MLPVNNFKWGKLNILINERISRKIQVCNSSLLNNSDDMIRINHTIFSFSRASLIVCNYVNQNRRRQPAWIDQLRVLARFQPAFRGKRKSVLDISANLIKSFLIMRTLIACISSTIFAVFNCSRSHPAQTSKCL